MKIYDIDELKSTNGFHDLTQTTFNYNIDVFKKFRDSRFGVRYKRAVSFEKSKMALNTHLGGQLARKVSLESKEDVRYAQVPKAAF